MPSIVLDIHNKVGEGTLRRVQIGILTLTLRLQLIAPLSLLYIHRDLKNVMTIELAHLIPTILTEEIQF